MSYLQNPSSKFIAITPDDDNDLSDANGEVTTRSIYIGFSGNLSIVNHEGDSVTFVGVVAGTFLPIQAKRVLATDTTAQNLVALY